MTLTPAKWVYGQVPNDQLKVGDRVQFTCNGRGRGGHCNVVAHVTKLNRKTFSAIEDLRSYNPGTLWRVTLDTENLYIVRT